MGTTPTAVVLATLAVSSTEMAIPCGRFAPSATGAAHPGTLLAGLLCWLDLRSQGGRAVLRIEDLDPQRCSPDKTKGLIDDLRWFGLQDWDVVEIQSAQSERHQRALSQLIDAGLVYACSCSRRQIREHQPPVRPARDGGWVYPGTCRPHHVTQDGAPAPWRLRQDGVVSIADESGADLSLDLAHDLGDPVIVRRDGGIAYHLASVVDDAAVGVNRVVRGRDLMWTSAGQSHLHRILGYPPPCYRHHFLFLEHRHTQPDPQQAEHAEHARHSAPMTKLAKFHGSVSVPVLRQVYDPSQLCGILAYCAGLIAQPTACRPQDLISEFSWDRVSRSDIPLYWDGQTLTVPASP